MKYSSESLPFRVEVWSRDGMHREELLATAANVQIAKLMFSAIALRQPGSRLMLRDRARVIDEHLPRDS